MGGGRGGGEVSSSYSSDYYSSEETDRQLSDVLFLNRKDKSGTTEDTVEKDNRIPMTGHEFDQMMERRNSKNTYQIVLQSYYDHTSPEDVKRSVDVAKEQVHSYCPGEWMDNDHDDFEKLYSVPTRTTLLLVGPKGSGKSNLINRISSLFKDWDDSPAPARAQVSTKIKRTEGGTQLLHGYTIPKGLKSVICLYDTPGLTGIGSCDETLLMRWMTEGVFDEVATIRNSENCATKKEPEHSVRDVNFVIYVVSAIPVLRAINVGAEEDKHAMQMLVRTYNSKHLCFGDDKPVVVMTHGDLLSLEDRAKVRTHLGELFGIPPVTQIFDIPCESSDPSTDLAILDMLKYSLEHADKNLPKKENLPGNEDLLKEEPIAPFTDSEDEASHCLYEVAGIDVFLENENLPREKHVSSTTDSDKSENLQKGKPTDPISYADKVLFVMSCFLILVGLALMASKEFGFPFPFLEWESDLTPVDNIHGLDLTSNIERNPTWNRDEEEPEPALGGENWVSGSKSEPSNHDQPTTVTANQPSDETNQKLTDYESWLTEEPDCEPWEEEYGPRVLRRIPSNGNRKHWEEAVDEDLRMNGRHRLWLEV